MNWIKGHWARPFMHTQTDAHYPNSEQIHYTPGQPKQKKTRSVFLQTESERDEFWKLNGISKFACTCTLTSLVFNVHRIEYLLWTECDQLFHPSLFLSAPNFYGFEIELSCVFEAFRYISTKLIMVYLILGTDFSLFKTITEPSQNFDEHDSIRMWKCEVVLPND